MDEETFLDRKAVGIIPKQWRASNKCIINEDVTCLEKHTPAFSAA